jgi:predicted alpha/beta superfamily hydrolase
MKLMWPGRTLACLGLLSALVAAQLAVGQQQPHTLAGDVRYHRNFHSRILGNDRDLIVYLPPGYCKDRNRRYPILYLQDGQNLFDGATSYIPGQEWRIDETAQMLIMAHKIEPLIIVGIYNTGRDRINEYTPVEDPHIKAGGKAELYGRFLVEELKPFIDATYRTRVDAAQTGLGGSSLGGLVTLYLGLKYPKVFGKLAVVSPSVWWGQRQIVKFVEASPHKLHPHVWLDIGTSEGRDDSEARNSLEDVRLLRQTLLKNGWHEGKELKYFEAPGALHNESAWAARTDKILEFLFPN